MATPRSIMVLLTGLSGVFHKPAPKFPVEVCTTIRVCLPVTVFKDTRKGMFFL